MSKIKFADLPELSHCRFAENYQFGEFAKVGEYAISVDLPWMQYWRYSAIAPTRPEIPIYSMSYVHRWMNNIEITDANTRYYGVRSTPFLLHMPKDVLLRRKIVTQNPKGTIKAYGKFDELEARVWLPSQDELEKCVSLGWMPRQNIVGSRDANPLTYKLFSTRHNFYYQQNYARLKGYAYMPIMIQPDPDVEFINNGNDIYVLSNIKELSDAKLALLLHSVPGFKRPV